MPFSYDSFLVDLDFAVAVADLQNFIFRSRASAVCRSGGIWRNCGSEGSPKSPPALLECILGADGKRPAEVIRFLPDTDRCQVRVRPPPAGPAPRRRNRAGFRVWSGRVCFRSAGSSRRCSPGIPLLPGTGAPAPPTAAGDPPRRRCTGRRQRVLPAH